MRPTRLAVVIALALSADAFGQNRRMSPGLVLDTGARHASCDALFFSPTGDQLFAAGDDKVVRVWQVGAEAILPPSKSFRWPIFREQRGGIHAVAATRDFGKLAIGGFGRITGFVAVMNPADGSITHAMSRPISAGPTWALAWSPDGKFVVIGDEFGDLYRWDPLQPTPVLFGAERSGRVNRVRLIAFVDDHHFLSVAQDGRVRRWDVRAAGKDSRSESRGQFRQRPLIRVAYSPKRQLLAARADGNEREVEFLAPGAESPPKPLLIPQAGAARYPTALEFDASGDLLAVGTQEVNSLPEGGKPFARVAGGKAFVYRLGAAAPKLLTPGGLDIGYRADNVAFRPGRDGQLATAGGPNHEVRLWDYRKAASLSTIDSPGGCLYGVAFSENGRYVAWRERLNPKPTSPNDRAAGSWRVFTLGDPKEHKVRQILAAPPKDFAPVAPIAELLGWSVEPTADGFLWRVKGPGVVADLSMETELYLKDFNQIPRCFTFLKPTKTTPVPRLAVGHMWGVSLYELHPGEVRFVRLMSGHESEVMSVAPSADGKLLLTASRDQTIACWGLENWPGQRELGADFSISAGGKILVNRVQPGGPAWEAGLADGDEIFVLRSIDRSRKTAFTFAPKGRDLAKEFGLPPFHRSVEHEPATAADAVRRLAAAQPGREYIFAWRHQGKEQIQLTTTRQRPLWRFFPTRRERGGDWILWRWRDFYYDTNSAAPDRLIGWHVNPIDGRHTDKPEFHPLSRFAAGFHKPAKVWPFAGRAFAEPERVMFADIEPPEVTVAVEQRPAKGVGGAADVPLRLRVVARPRSPGDQQKISRVTVWLNDHDARAKLPKLDEKGADGVVEIAPDALRRGENEVTVTCFNAVGGRGEARATLRFVDPTRKKPTLWALCVGVNDNLHYAEKDAEVLAAVLRQHDASELFADSKVKLLQGAGATTRAILAQLKAAAAGCQPDDLFVLHLAGHGSAEVEDDNSPVPNSFFYQSAGAKPDGRDALKVADLRAALGAIRCRKLILLDTCHSGAVASEPTRDLKSDGTPFVIFSACKGHESAIEMNPKEQGKLKDRELQALRQGFFTQSLLLALGRPEEVGKAGRARAVNAAEMQGAIQSGVERLMERVYKETGRRYNQTPVFEPEYLPANLELLCRP